MLDRKTKDIDADVELLEDRVKQSKYIIYAWLVLAISFLSLSIIALIMKSGIGAAAFAIGALVVFIIEEININYKKSLEILLYLKRQFEKKKEK